MRMSDTISVMFDRLNPFGTRTRPVTLYECRICGCALDTEVGECQQCGSSEIARYEL